ncbi:MAG: DUF5686 and carboxypeptidase regulatory-like domain-containing protein [Luteibaculaceae bacterium]
MHRLFLVFKAWLFILVSLTFVNPLFSSGITGTVKNQVGEPLPFATIQVFNSTLGTITNMDGNYFLTLPQGQYQVYFQYLGYKTQKITVDVGSTEKKIDIILEPQAYNLAEFTYKAGTEDAAYEIMRRAIALAKLHDISIESFEAKSYIKGSFTLTKIPWLMKKAIKDADIQEGTTYVLESVNEIKFKRPNTREERVISSRSNLPPGSEPSIGFLNTSLYKPMIGDFISPLSPRAFATYRFRYLGGFFDGEQTVVKVEVIPKSKGPNVFSGIIQLVEPSYAIHSLDLQFTDDQGIKYHLKQIMAPFNNIWMPITQEILMDLGIMGVKANGSYVTSIRSYKVTPSAAFAKIPIKNTVSAEPSAEPKDVAIGSEQPITKREAKKIKKEIIEQEQEKQREDGADTDVVRSYSFKVDSLAFQTPDSIWNSLRQVPLTEVEVKGYQKADSLYLIRRERQEKDSIKALPRFKIGHVLSGHYYNYGENTKERGYLKTLHFEGLLGGLESLDLYNTVDGLVVKTGLHYTKKFKDFDSYTLGSTLRYAGARQNLHGLLYAKRQYKDAQIKVSAGRMVYQLNGENPISNGVNLIYTLLAQQNFLKLYEKDFVRISGDKQISTTWQARGSAEYTRRRTLDNNSSFSFINVSDREFSSNQPNNRVIGNTGFDTHQAILVNYDLIWRPFSKKVIFNDKEYITNRYNPTFRFSNYIGLLDAPFNRMEVSVNQDVKLGKGNNFEYEFVAGGFVGNKPEIFVDFFHLLGNQTIFAGERNQFRSLDYYGFSTNSTYFQGYFTYNFRKLLFSRINALKMIGVKESLFLNQALVSGASYTEAGYRFIGVARAFGVDVFGGYLNGEFNQVGARVVVPF